MCSQSHTLIKAIQTKHTDRGNITGLDMRVTTRNYAAGLEKTTYIIFKLRMCSWVLSWQQNWRLLGISFVFCCFEAQILMRERKDGRKVGGNEWLGCPMWHSTNPLALLALLVQRGSDTQPPISSLAIWQPTSYFKYMETYARVYTNTPSVWTLGSLMGTDAVSRLQS